MLPQISVCGAHSASFRVAPETRCASDASNLSNSRGTCYSLRKMEIEDALHVIYLEKLPAAFSRIDGVGTPGRCQKPNISLAKTGNNISIGVLS